MSWMHGIKIKHQVVLVVLIAVLPALLIILLFGYQQRRWVMADAKQDCRNYALRMAGEIEALHQSFRLMLQGMAETSEMQERNAAACSALFTKIVSRNPHITSLTAADPEGRLWAALVPLTNVVAVGDRKWFQTVVRTRAFAAGEYIVSRTTGHSVFSFACPVLDPTGRLTSALHVGVSLAGIEEAARRVALPPGATYTVADWRGVILTATGRNATRSGQRDDPELFERTRTDWGSSTFSAVLPDRQTVFASCSSVGLSGASAPLCMYAWRSRRPSWFFPLSASRCSLCAGSWPPHCWPWRGPGLWAIAWWGRGSAS